MSSDEDFRDSDAYIEGWEETDTASEYSSLEVDSDGEACREGEDEDKSRPNEHLSPESGVNENHDKIAELLKGWTFNSDVLAGLKPRVKPTLVQPCNGIDVLADAKPTLVQACSGVNPAVGFTKNFSVLECVKKFITYDIVNHIVTCTNERAKTFIDGNPSKDRIGHIMWCDVTEDDIFVFLALSFYTGICKFSEISDYWSRKPYEPGIHFFCSSIMSKDRYLAIKRFLRFARAKDIKPDVASTYLDTFCDKVRRPMMHNVDAGQQIAIGKAVVMQRGEQIWYRQIIKSKLSSKGVKLFVMCNGDKAWKGYCYNFSVHYNNKCYQNFVLPDVEGVRVLSSSEKRVVHLSKSILGQGRHIFVDCCPVHVKPRLKGFLMTQDTFFTDILNCRANEVPPRTAKRKWFGEAGCTRKKSTSVVNKNTPVGLVNKSIPVVNSPNKRKEITPVVNLPNKRIKRTPVVKSPNKREVFVVETKGVPNPVVTATKGVSNSVVTTTNVISNPVVTATKGVSNSVATTTNVISNPVVAAAKGVSNSLVTTTNVISNPVVTATKGVSNPVVVTITTVVSNTDVTATKKVSNPVVTATKSVSNPVVVTVTKNISNPVIATKKVSIPVVTATKGVSNPVVATITTVVSNTDVTATKKVSIPVVTVTKGVSNPVVIATKNISNPVVIATKKVSIPVVTATKGVSNPVVTATKNVSNPVVTARKGVSNPVVTATKNISNPVVTATKNISNHVVIVTKNVSSSVVTATNGVSNPVEIDKDKTHFCVGRAVQKKPQVIGTRKPWMLLMGAVDKADKLLEPVDVTRNFRVRFKKLGFHLLMRLLLNSFFVYKNVVNRRCTFRQFIIQAVEQMIEAHSSTGFTSLKQKFISKYPKSICKREPEETVTHAFVPLHVLPGSPKNEKKPCKACPKYRYSSFCCDGCPEIPGFCSIEHFNMWHIYRRHLLE